MGKPAAKEGDIISSPADIHMVQVPTPSGVATVPLPHPFKGKLTEALSRNVRIEGKPAATSGSWGENKPKHVALGIKFQNDPSNEGRVFLGSSTVRINKKQAARAGDPVLTCNDPTDLPIGKIQANSKVRIG